jgi:translation elongation factor EF-Tu-like GTPase
MLLVEKYFEIEAKIKLYNVDKGRKSFITSGYRPHIYFGFSDPTNISFSSDCIIKLINKDKLNPGEVGFVRILVFKYTHLKELLEKDVKLKIKEGIRFVGIGTITRIIGEK